MKGKATVLAALVCLATAVAYVRLELLGPSATPTDASSGDLLAYYYPMLRWGFGELARLRLPLWNPHQSCGTPFLAVPNVGFFYPLYATFLVLPADTAVTVDLVLHLTIASLGMFLLCRHFGMRPAAAVIAGIVYAYQGGMAIKVYFPNFIAPAAWMPVVFLLVDRLLENGSGRVAALLAAVVGAMLLAGNLQFIYFTALALVPFVVARGLVVARRDGPAVALRAAGLAVLAAGAAILVASVRVVPAAEFMQGTWRPPGTMPEATAALMSMPPARLAANLLSPVPGMGIARQAYVGTLPLVLAAVGLVLWPRRSVALPIALAGAGAALYALGEGGPVFPLLFRLPMGSWFRGPDRALVVLGFAVAVLCGAGLEEILRRGARAGVVFAVAAAVAAAGAVAVGAPGVGLLVLYCLAGGLVVAMLLARGAGPVRVAALAALALLVVVDLFHCQRPGGALPSALGRYFARYEPFFADIRARQGFARTFIRATSEPDGRLFFHSDLAKAGLNHGLWQATDYEPLCDARFQRFLEFPNDPWPLGSICYWPTRISATTLPLLELMGVRFFMFADGDAAAGAVPSSWQLLRRENGVSLFEDPAALPRAFVASEVIAVSEPETLLPRMTGADLRRVAFVEGTDAPPAAGGGSARITDYAADAVTIEARAEQGGLLVLTDRWDPGWRATLDGAPARIYRTDYLFRGVALPPGEHVVELRYRPRSFLVGAAGSLLGLALLAALASRRTRRR